MIIDIQGYCPACGNKSLHTYSHDGFVICMHPDCPDQDAAGKILSDPEIHHIVRFDEDGYFNAKHPLRERIDGDLLDCTIYEDAIAEWVGTPTQARKNEIADTTWRVKAASEHNLDANWIWERL